MNNINDIRKEDSKVFIALSPDYPNVGDIAICINQIKLLEKVFPNRKLIEIPIFNFDIYKAKMEKNINPDDIITIIGGGNMGNIWIKCEEIRRDLISTFPNNKIISFPQSIDFENNRAGNNEFQKTIKIYNNHNNLTIFSREQKSYEIMKSNFKNNVYLVPDMVMNSSELQNKKDSKRTQFSLCFRNDKEKATSKDIIEKLVKLLENNNIRDIKIFDTVIDDLEFKSEEKENIFNDMLNNFRNSKVIITDRLHGMIFSLITKTPCIALDNSNKKISSTYNTWLSNIPYIKLLNGYDESKIIEYISIFKTIDTRSINLDFSNNFETLYNTLKGD